MQNSGQIINFDLPNLLLHVIDEYLVQPIIYYRFMIVISI